MKKAFLLLPLLLLLTSMATVLSQEKDFHFSQTAGYSNYQSETIHLRFATYVKNNERFDLGLVGEGLKHEMMVSAEAIAVFNQYQKQRRWTLVFAGLQLATQIAAFTSRDKSTRTGLFIGAGVISVISVPIYIGSQKNLNHAIWIRNGAVLK
jgi:hypothetical protein